MLLEVLYLCPWLPHEEGPGPVAANEGLVGVLHISVLLIHFQHILQLAKPDPTEIYGYSEISK